MRRGGGLMAALALLAGCDRAPPADAPAQQERAALSNSPIVGSWRAQQPVRFTGEKLDGNLGLVNTRIVTRRGQEIPIDYRLLNRDGRWRVYEVLVEGVSMISNFRTQFDKLIRTSGYAELVKRLRAKGAALQT